MLTGVGEVQEIVPHRHPFLLVGCIEELGPGMRAVGYKHVIYGESFFKGHFPQEPVIPDVLLAGTLAQVRTVVILSQEGFRGKVAYFGGIEKAKFEHKVMSGDRIRLECEIIKQRRLVGVGKTTTTVDGKLAVNTEFTFTVG